MTGFDLNDFSSLGSTEGQWCELRHPVTDAPLVNNVDGKIMRVKLIGMDSPTFAAKSREFMNRRIKRNKLNLGSAEQLEAEKAETLAACTVGWENMVNQGKPWEYSPENALALYMDPKLKWLREQVDEFIGDRANFLQPSKTS